jgi:importin-4
VNYLPTCYYSITDIARSVVAALCVGFAETINKVGPAFLEGSTYIFFDISLRTKLLISGTDHISSIAVQILEQKAFCQQDPDQDEDEEAPEDQAEYDSVLISSAGDLVAALANALGSDFLPAFTTFFPLISKYYVRVS